MVRGAPERPIEVRDVRYGRHNLDTATDQFNISSQITDSHDETWRRFDDPVEMVLYPLNRPCLEGDEQHGQVRVQRNIEEHDATFFYSVPPPCSFFVF